jgi:pimeloyl-ACP methyl ester carboxylesterase
MENQLKVKFNRKPPFSKYMASFFKWLGILILFIIVIGFAYHQIVMKITADKYPPVGEMVDIGNYNLHMYTRGEGNGKPTIVLESGLGTPSSYKDWEYIQEKLSQYTKVISYDRAGYGWSNSAKNERTAEQIADDLHQLLHEAGEKGPFILVGHSFGGFTQQVFAHKYKDEAAGLVLVDSSHVEQEGGSSNAEIYLIRALKEIGVGHLLELINMLPIYDYFVEDKTSVHFFHQHFYNSNQISEMQNMMTKSAEQVRAAQKAGYGDIPLRIISAEHEEYPEWTELQEQNASLSTNGKHLVVKGASHYIHLDKPELVIDTIIELLEENY